MIGTVMRRFLPPQWGEGWNGLCLPSPLTGGSGAQHRARVLAAHAAPRAQPPAAAALSRGGRGQKEPGGKAVPLSRAASGQKAAALSLVAAALLLPTTAGAAASGGAVDPFVFQLSVFVLAIFVGYYVVWSVTPALHTPLMSVTNAISSVIVVGALLAVGVEHAAGDLPASLDGAIASKIFGLLALAMAAVNIFGGFLVTQRMLAMYKKKEKK